MDINQNQTTPQTQGVNQQIQQVKKPKLTQEEKDKLAEQKIEKLKLVIQKTKIKIKKLTNMSRNKANEYLAKCYVDILKLENNKKKNQQAHSFTFHYNNLIKNTPEKYHIQMEKYIDNILIEKPKKKEENISK